MTKGKAKARRRAVRRTRHALNRDVNFLTRASARLLHKRSGTHPVRSMVRERAGEALVFANGYKMDGYRDY
jgi:hypothetical protein